MKETYIEIVDLLKIELDKFDFILQGKDAFVRKSKEFRFHKAILRPRSGLSFYCS